MTVTAGDTLPELTIEHVDPEKMKTMAALLQDSNPIHWDVASVRRLGLGDRVVNQGPNNMAYVVNMLAAFAGGPENVLRLRVRFLDNVFAGDRLVAGGTVTEVTEETIECDVWLAKDGDQPVLSGSAVVRAKPQSR